MSTVLSLIALIIFTIIPLFIYNTSNLDHWRVYLSRDDKKNKSVISKNMQYTIFVVCTAPFFLQQFSLVKYGAYFLTVIFLLALRRVRPKFDSILFCYLLFYLWSIIRCYNTTHPYDAFALMIKYTIPIISLWLGYSSIQNSSDIVNFAKSVVKYCVIYAFVIGGFSALFMPWLYWSPIGALFLKYAGFADYITSLFILPFILFTVENRYKYIAIAGWLFLSSVLESVRTGIGGMVLVIIAYFFFKHKEKSIFGIIFSLSLFIAVILYVPEINEKFFGEKAGTITIQDVTGGDALSLDNIQTSGRSFMWNLALTKFYEPSPIVGSGLGVTYGFFKERAIRENTIAILHNDYIMILCETGVVGIILFVLFYISILIKVFYYTWINKRNKWVVISGITAVASMCGVAFSMYFDNVVSHSMTSLINPFMFIGFFLKYIELSKDGSLSE